jgi:hypothetical protein
MRNVRAPDPVTLCIYSIPLAARQYVLRRPLPGDAASHIVIIRLNDGRFDLLACFLPSVISTVTPL